MSRIGLGRLHLIELLLTCVTARRSPLSLALAGCQPPLMFAVATMLSQHPSSSIIAEKAIR